MGADRTEPQTWPAHLPACRPHEGWCIHNCPRFPYLYAALRPPATLSGSSPANEANER